MILGRQTAAASAGTVGHAFAYRLSGLVTFTAGVIGVNGGPVVVTLVGRTNGMAGDGITTDPRVYYYTAGPPSRIVARFNGLAGATFWVQSRSVIQEFVA